MADEQRINAEGWKDPNHEWKPEVLLKVPTWAPEYMQFTVMLYRCGKCGAYKTELAKDSDGNAYYVTPACSESLPKGD